MRDRVPRLAVGATLARVGGEWVGASAGRTLHSFDNETAQRIASLIDGKRTVGDLIEVLCSEFDVPPGRCAVEVEALLLALERKGLLAMDAQTGARTTTQGNVLEGA